MIFMGIGTAQIIVIFLLILLFFGAKRLPEIAKAMGKASVEFKKARDEMLMAGSSQAEEKKEPQLDKVAEEAENKDEQQSV